MDIITWAIAFPLLFLICAYLLSVFICVCAVLIMHLFHGDKKRHHYRFTESELCARDAELARAAILKNVQEKADKLRERQAEILKEQLGFRERWSSRSQPAAVTNQ
jgi:hypothetical protein